jgi:hypothetical protein
VNRIERCGDPKVVEDGKYPLRYLMGVEVDAHKALDYIELSSAEMAENGDCHDDIPTMTSRLPFCLGFRWSA